MDFLKPFQIGGEQTGFVFFGQRLAGTANLIVGPLFGLYLSVYALGIWHQKRFALPMGHAYATYVVLNLLMYTMKNPMPPEIGYRIFGFVYIFVALGVAVGAAVFLTKHKASLT